MNAILSGCRAAAGSGDDAGFSEDLQDFSGSSDAQIKAATDEALGDLLSRLERLRYRAIERWGGQPYLDALGRWCSAHGSPAWDLLDGKGPSL